MHNNGIITAPVNTDDISAVLGVASHDIGTLCLSTQIRRFNKNKPYRGTSPAVANRNTTADNNGDNGTGKFLGNRGRATGHPVYWGMRYPMNTAQQNYSGLATKTLLSLCTEICSGMMGGNHGNYSYQKPVAGTDYFREDDFVGYQHSMGAFLDAGVAGANEASMSTAKLNVNYFEEADLIIYALIPPTAPGWTFKDLIPEESRYYLVAEFYKTNAWSIGSTATPFLVKQSATSLNTDSLSMYLPVTLSEIATAGGFSFNGTSAQSFYVCVGFNKRNASNTDWESGAAFVAPWEPPYAKCATLVKVEGQSPYIVEILGYKFPPLNSATAFLPISTTEVNASNKSDTLFFEAKITNNSNSPLKIYTENYQSGGLMFRMTAHGAYGKYHDDNGNHLTAGGTDYHGAPRILEIFTSKTASNSTQMIQIAAKSSQTIYFRAASLLPYGETGILVTEVTKDGTNWAVSGQETCNFKRIP